MSVLPSTTKDDAKYPQWHNVVAGAAAGAGARLLTAPFDLIKIRRQLHTKSASAYLSSSSTKIAGTSSCASQAGILSSMSQIIKNEGGIKGLFRGNVAATYLWIGYAAVQFSLYARTSNSLTNFATLNPAPMAEILAPSHVLNQATSTPNLKSFQDAYTHALNVIGSNPTSVAFCSGAIAGVAATLATYPFDICRTIFSARGATSSAIAATMTDTPPPPRSLYQFAQTMYKRNGIRGFFVGVVPAVVQIIPYMGINFALYDYLVRKGGINKNKSVEKENSISSRLNASSAGMAGFIAGGTSKVLIYPLDTVKKRLQAQTFMLTTSPSTSASMIESASGFITNAKYRGMLDCILTISKEEGLTAFYKGLVPTALKSMMGTGFSFFFFTFTKNT